MCQNVQKNCNFSIFWQFWGHQSSDEKSNFHFLVSENHLLGISFIFFFFQKWPKNSVLFDKIGKFWHLAKEDGLRAMIPTREISLRASLDHRFRKSARKGTLIPRLRDISARELWSMAPALVNYYLEIYLAEIQIFWNKNLEIRIYL